MKKTIFILLVMVFSENLLAAGLFAPSWRGQERTVYAYWDNWVIVPGPVTHFLFPPDEQIIGSGQVALPYSDSYAAHSGRVVGGVNPVDVLENYADKSNVLRINKSVFRAGLPNFLGGDSCIIRFEVSYFGANFTNFNVQATGANGSMIPGYANDIIVPELIASSSDNGWITNAYEFCILPENPVWEGFSINFEGYPAYIDYMVFDTLCVPEPASLFLLGLGGLLLRKK